MARRGKGAPQRPQAAVELPPNVAALLGEDAPRLLAALAGPAPTSIRLNPLKPMPAPSGDPVPWCAQGRYLHERPAFTLDPFLHAGCYYVQEAGSMLIEQAFGTSALGARDILALDLCAAPGGKSTHLAALLSEGSMLICNEPVPQRRQILAENVWKQGRAGTAIAHAQPGAIARAGVLFDLILVDAPCSGEGMFRKDPFAREQWSERLVAACAHTQRSILDQAWQSLATGGYLIYSTCTWEEAENEAQVEYLLSLGAEYIPIPMDPAWGVQTTAFGNRCYPHRARGEGFFIALIRKPGELPTHHADVHPRDEHPWIREAYRYRMLWHERIGYAVPAAWHATVERLMAAELLEHPGTPIARMKGELAKPHEALALNGLLEQGAFQAIDLDHDEALHYLRGNTIAGEGAAGMALVRRGGQPIGWCNGAGNRWNNLWPAPWRIRQR